MARILVIEDDAGLRARLVKILRFEGHDTVAAADGREGIEIARRERPDVVISDLMMPGINGFGTCRALRDDPRTRSIPVRALTALGSESDRERLHSLGAAEAVPHGGAARRLATLPDGRDAITTISDR